MNLTKYLTIPFEEDFELVVDLLKEDISTELRFFKIPDMRLEFAVLEEMEYQKGKNSATQAYAHFGNSIAEITVFDGAYGLSTSNPNETSIVVADATFSAEPQQRRAYLGLLRLLFSETRVRRHPKLEHFHNSTNLAAFLANHAPDNGIGLTTHVIQQELRLLRRIAMESPSSPIDVYEFGEYFANGFSAKELRRKFIQSANCPEGKFSYSGENAIVFSYDSE